MDGLLGGRLPLLSDVNLAVADSYGMSVRLGQQAMAAMGYVIVDSQGLIRHREIDPLFGDHADRILRLLKEATP